MMVQDLTDRQRIRAFRALQSMCLESHHSDIHLLIKAYHGFAPKAVDGLAVRVCFMRDGTECQASGHLRLQSQEAKRGSWFTYTVELDQPDHRAAIRFCGLCHWSNIKEVQFLDGRGKYRKANPFFDPDV